MVLRENSKVSPIRSSPYVAVSNNKQLEKNINYKSLHKSESLKLQQIFLKAHEIKGKQYEQGSKKKKKKSDKLDTSQRTDSLSLYKNACTNHDLLGADLAGNP